MTLTVSPAVDKFTLENASTFCRMPASGVPSLSLSADLLKSAIMPVRTNFRGKRRCFAGSLRSSAQAPRSENQKASPVPDVSSLLRSTPKGETNGQGSDTDPQWQHQAKHFFVLSNAGEILADHLSSLKLGPVTDACVSTKPRRLGLHQQGIC